MIAEKEVFIRLIAAFLLGGLIGWERELHDRPAGFRTHLLVSVGSALIMLVSLAMFYMFEGSRADPGRIAAQVVSGIGFLGAGTIIREGANVKGLTTAASLWTTAGIGLACGVGMYFSAFVATSLVFVILMFLNRFETKFSGKDELRGIEIRAVDRIGLLGDLGSILGAKGLNIINITTEHNSEDELKRIKIKVAIPPNLDVSGLNEEMYRIPGVSFVEWKKR